MDSDELGRILAHVTGSPANVGLLVNILARLAIITLLLNSAFTGEPGLSTLFLSGCSNSI